MDWDSYKQLCDQPGVLSRWLLEQTARVCNTEYQNLIKAVLLEDPLPKPVDHRGNRATDMFAISLARDQIIQILDFVAGACRRDFKTDAPVARDYSGIEREWQEYLKSLS